MADDIGSKLGFDASQAIAQIERLKRELDSYTAAMSKAAGGAQNFNSQQSQVDDTLQRLATQAELAAGALRGLTKAQADNNRVAREAAALNARQTNQQAAFQKALNIDPAKIPQPFGDTLALAGAKKQQESLRATETALRNLVRTGTQSTQQLATGINKATQASNQLGLSWQSVIRIFSVQFAAQAVSQLVGAFTNGVSEAREFEITLARIQTISSEFANQSLDDIGRIVTNLSEQFGVPAQLVAEGLYETISNQVGDAAESVRVLSEALKFAAVTGADAASAGNLLAGTLNAYNLSAASAARLSDEFFRTIDLGRVTGQELANSLGRVITISAQLGVTTAEVNSALATLTIQGVNTSDAVTQLLNVEQKLLHPTEALKDVFRELGIESAEAGISLFGLEGFLQEIAKVGGDSATELGNLFNEIRGTRGVIGLVGTASQKAAENLREIENSARATADAFELINATPAQRAAQQLADAKNLIVNDFGRPVIEFLTNLVDSLGGARNALIALSAVFGTLVAGASLIFTAQIINGVITFTAAIRALGVVSATTTGQMLALRAASLAWPAAVAAGVGVAFVALTRFRDSTEETKTAIQGLQDQADQGIALKIEQAQGGIREAQAAVQEQTKVVQEGFRQRLLEIDKDRVANITANAAITGDLARSVTSRTELIRKSVQAVEQFITNTVNRTKSLVDQIDSALKGIDADQFERRVSSLDPFAQARARLEESSRLAQRARELASRGDEESQRQAVELFQQSIQQATQVAENQSTRRQGEEALNRLRGEGFKLEAELTKVNNQQVAQAQQQLDLEKQKSAEAEKFAKAQIEAAKQGNLLSTAIENNTNNLIVFGEQGKTSLEQVNAAFDGLIANLDQLEARIRAQEGGAAAPTGPGTSLGNLQAEIAAVEEIRVKALEAARTGNTELLNTIQQGLIAQSNVLLEQINAQGFGQRFANAIFGSSEEAIRNSLSLVSQEIDQAAIAFAKLKVEQSQTDSIRAAGEALRTFAEQSRAGQVNATDFINAFQSIGLNAKSAADSLQGVNTGAAAAQQGINSAQAAANAYNTSAAVSQNNRLAQSFLDVAAARAAAAGGGGLAARTGALVHKFAMGGFAPRGTDTVPAMLTPGEFVVNARDSKRFFAELVAINSGRRPIYRAEGGPVTTNVGDININIPPGSGPVDARQLAKELRRQMKRGTARL